MANLAITLLAFLCAIHQSFQCSYGPDYKILTIAELTQKAPIVVQGYVVIKGDNVISYKACLYITHVYKGSGVKNYICATNFGSGAACKSDPFYNVEYLFFLNQEGNQQFGYTYAVRYDNGLFSGTKIFNKEALDGVREGKCCAGVPNFSAHCKYLSCGARPAGNDGPLICSCGRTGPPGTPGAIGAKGEQGSM